MEEIRGMGGGDRAWGVIHGRKRHEGGGKERVGGRGVTVVVGALGGGQPADEVGEEHPVARRRVCVVVGPAAGGGGGWAFTMAETLSGKSGAANVAKTGIGANLP